jgi:shikimate dehydrogenase
MSMKAAVLGSPISHSLSPSLHRAAYQVLGIDIEYTAIDTSIVQLAGRIDELSANHVGYSLTMPLKLDVLTLVSARSSLVEQTGCANTVYRNSHGEWALENTDVFGITQTIRRAGIDSVESATIIGSGATGRSALSALNHLGVREVTCIARNQDSAERIRSQGEALGIQVECADFAQEISFASELAISTVPGSAQDQIVSKIYARQNLPLLFDISYNPWPSDLGSYWKEHGGGAVLGGIEMLLWQASVQVELFTGLPAPVDAMRAALSNGLSTT